MARFYVGQRVRLARATYPENEGLEGAIVEFGFWPKGTKCQDGRLGIDANCLVQFDAYSLRSGQHTDQLEPLIKPDNEVGSWEELNFHPSQFDRVTT